MAVVVAGRGARGVDATLRSLLNQTHLPDQIVVVDDRWSDDAARVAAELGAAVLRPPQPLESTVAARNFALEFVSGDILVALDAPGRLHSEAIVRTLEGLAQSEDVDRADVPLVRYVCPTDDGRHIEFLCALPPIIQPQSDDRDHDGDRAVTCVAVRLDDLRRAGGFPATPGTARPDRDRPMVAVVVPAYNEEAHIERALRSIFAQTTPPDRVIVVDDCSSDRTGEIALGLGAEVVRALRNTGNKASAHNLALPLVAEDIVVNVDGDTALAPDALERLLAPFADSAIAAASGAVLPYDPDSAWERGRVLEYLSYQTFFRAVEARIGTPLVLLGCFSAFRTRELAGRGGFRPRTVTEDMDMNWELLLEGRRVAFVQDAVCFAKDPSTLRVFHRQVSRWTRGFLQCLTVHRGQLGRNSRLALFAWVAVIEALLTPLYAAAAVWLLLTWGWEAMMTLLALDAAVTLTPVLAGSRRYRIPVRFVLRNAPALYRNRAVFALVMLESILLEWVFRRRLTAWDKGHA